MSEIKKYLAPNVAPDKKFSSIIKGLKSSLQVLLHGLLPHQAAKPAEEQFKAENISVDEEYLAEVAMELYNESTKRIDALEEKGFKLLTYISAISAISVYFISTAISGYFKYTVVLSLITLVLAIIISLRCIGIKSQKALFIDSLFTFYPDSPPVSKQKKEIIAGLINCATFNQTVADNTADILRASRFMLSIGIWTTAISCIFFLYHSPEKSEERVMKFADSTLIRQSLKGIQSQIKAKDEVSEQLVILSQKLDSVVRVQKNKQITLSKQTK